jgi:hypothetical protein
VGCDIWAAYTGCQGISHMGSSTSSRALATAVPSRMRAALMLRRQYTSQQPSANRHMDTSVAGVSASQPSPTSSNALPMAGCSGPGALTSGVGIANTPMHIAIRTPKPCMTVRVTIA